MRQALRRVREAIGLFRHDADTLALVPNLRMPGPLKTAIEDASVARQRAFDAATQASTALRHATRALDDAGLSRRDAATLLGISHQRVQQLVDGT